MITVTCAISAAQLQDIIDTAAPGETISLEAGTFTFDRTIVIERDDIAITGAGSDATRIVMTGDAVTTGAFRIGSVIDQSVGSGDFALEQAAAEGATAITLRDASGLGVGDVLWIERPNTAEYLDSIGDTEWRDDKPLRTTMVEIAAIEGTTVTLKNGLAFDFDAADAVVTRIEVTRSVRVGGFSIDSGLPESDPAYFENVNADFWRDNVVSVSATSGLQLFDIDVREAPSNGFTFAQSIFLEATDLTVDGAHNKGDGGNGYAFQLRALYDSNLSGLEAYDTRHAVLFASWTSEANNTIHVRSTNRDINFHGGPDHHNTVIVDESIRDETEASYLSPALFINDTGTSYGAPTDPDANSVTFKTVWATNKADFLVAHESGAEMHGRARAPHRVGGPRAAPRDGGNGPPPRYGGPGSDILDGGVGTDALHYAGDLADYHVTTDAAGRLVIHKADGYDIVSGVESFVFADQALASTGLPIDGKTWFGTEGADDITVSGSNDVVLAGAGFDRVYSAYGFTLGDDAEALELTGTAAVDGAGNALANTLAGNDAANSLSGMAGNDRIFARGGNDSVRGGEGDDTLYGQAGNDRLDGGDGNDQLYGASGADTFVFSAGHDIVRDFSIGEGDRLEVNATMFDSAEFDAAFRLAALASGDTLNELGIDVSQVDEGSQYHIDIKTMGDDGSVLAVSLYGETLADLLVGSEWIA